ncbi:hypothetical protein LSTR_LSTR014342 [Laodelphax striatellus]|uniref:PIK-related kinase FAT domain-containing protein n=1 Tax=Laodelphax striatellus TaxID=195883 RepID=A0A482WZE3_LAOST|nr:hypothetical protein LSTR_LSTR014342 [Laodelphax striatellus]
MLQPVRTFFHTNKSTCAEWLTRIRLAVVVVSLHCGLAASAVRNGHCLLQDLLDSGNTQGPEFETAVLYVAWGLSRLQEAEAVQGLYAWCRDTVGSKLPFLKPLVEHAASRYEQAIDQYKMLLNNEVFDSPAKTSSVPIEEERKPCSANIVHTLKPLVADQLTECYLALQDWNGLQEWKELEVKLLPNQNGNASKRFKFVTTTSAKSMEAFDSGDVAAAEQLLNWTCPQGEGGDTPPSWNCYQLLGDTSHSLMNVAVKMAAGGAQFAIDDNCRKHLLHCKSMANACVVESVRNVPSEILNEATLLQFAANALLPDGAAAADGGVASFLSVAEPTHNKRKQLDSRMLAQVHWWCSALQLTAAGNHRKSCDELSLQLAKTARKEGNIGLASRQMYKQLKDVLGLGVEETNGVNNLAKSVLNGLKDMSAMVWTDHKAAVLYEIAKLQYSMGHRDTALQLCTTVAFELAATPTTTSAAAEGAWLRERCARMLLTLAKWQQAAAGSTADDVIGSLDKLLDACDSVNRAGKCVDASLLDVMNCDLSPNTVVSAGDSVTGRLLREAVVQCGGGGAKAWASLANWAYRWGRRVLDRTEHVLSDAEKAAIDQLLLAAPASVGVDAERVYAILVHNRPSADEEEDIEAENMHTSEMVEWQLQEVGAFTDDQLSALVEMWRRSHARVYTYYELAAHAYFKYLQLLAADQHTTQVQQHWLLGISSESVMF